MPAIVSKSFIDYRVRVEGLLPARIQLASYYDSLNLRGALVDLGDFRVAEETFDGIVLYVAVSAQDLNGLRRHPHSRLARLKLCHGAELRDALAAILRGRGRVQQRAR